MTFRDVANLIDNFLAKRITFKKFEDDFLAIYLNEYEKFTEEEQDFMDNINEKTEYTSGKVTEEERNYDWITHDEFQKWLEDYKQKNIKFWKGQ